jgi:FkbM family methyltransferase
MIFSTPNEAARWRVKTFFDKEPETLAWIASIPKGDILVDIGANVGMYSIYAAVEHALSVVSVEPESQNYALLNENIYRNKVSNLVIAYPYAMGSERGHDLLHLSQWGAAGSCHAAGEKIAFNGEGFEPRFSQGVIKTTLDDLFSPNADSRLHIKIDVDGFEPKVVQGAQQLISLGCIKSMLIEINENLVSHRELVDLLCGEGFIYSPEQVALSLRKEGPFEGCANYIFVRG